MEPATHPIPERLMSLQALDGLPALLTRHGCGPKLMLVCDDLTWIAAGAQADVLLADKYSVTTYSLGHPVHADLRHSRDLMSASHGYDALIAVGAGTINDIVKYAAAKLRIPYFCVATAASMNGYLSANASLTADGMKHSYPAAPPRAVIADIGMIARAPKRLARAGLGDTLCRSTVEADMMLSHFLLDTPYPRAIFDRLRRHESALIAHASQLPKGDPVYLTQLMETLLDAGDAMTQFGSSAVASQGEHMIAHTAEAMYPAPLARVMHGELIAVTTLTMSLLQAPFLKTTPTIRELFYPPSRFLRVFGQQSGDGLAEQYAKKLLSAEQMADINIRIARDWQAIAEAITAIHVIPSKIERSFKLVGLPVRPNDLRLDLERYHTAVCYAHLARDRFTFLDLEAMRREENYPRPR